jgi:predicted O-linked N-acetylglucosamine transferase (SPINDLY family)
MAAFPFGNTNSTVDAASLGLPTICHFGDEPSSQADKCVVDIAGLPSFLVNRTDDEYYATALKIVHDESFRIAFKKQSGNGEIGNKLFSSNGQSLDAGFTRLVEYVYRNNEMLLDRKVIKIDEAVSDIA